MVLLICLLLLFIVLFGVGITVHGLLVLAIIAAIFAIATGGWGGMGYYRRRRLR